MKFKIINMLVILGMLSVMPMIYMGKLDLTSLDPMALLDSAPDVPDINLNAIKANTPDSLKSVVSEEKVQVYKWRDKNGVMQFSNTPPNDTRAEQVELDPNSNLMQAVKVEKKVEPEKKVVAEGTPSPYSPKDMKKAMESAKDVERMLQDRHEQQQKMMNNL